MNKGTVLVTGGSRGIGKAIVMAFAERGYNVATCGRDKSKLEELLVDTKDYTGKIYTQVCDVRNKSEIDSFVTNAVKEFGQIDVTVNNAGVFIPGSIQDEKDETFVQMMEVNLNATYYFSKATIPYLKKSNKGHLINICSTASITPYINGGSYCISKYAQYGLTKVLREELKADGVKVTAVLPGATLTDSWSGTELPSSRFINPESIANLILTTYELPKEAVVEELLVRPQLGDID